MRKKLIEKLLKEFEKDKEVIERNLLEASDNIALEAKNEYETAVLTIVVYKNHQIGK